MDDVPQPSCPASHAASSRAFGLRARWRSFRYAGAGIRMLVRHEHNARLHLAATVLVVVAGLALRFSLDDWRWIIVSVALVWMAEAFNTAIERLCDRVCIERDPLIGAAKDVAAGAVLIAALAAVSIGLATFLPHLQEIG